jgi:HEAT repeat protein
MAWLFNKNQKDPDVLVGELGSPEKEVSEEAFNALIQHKSTNTDGVLLGVLESSSILENGVLAAIVEIAGKRKLLEASHIFEEGLKSESFEVKSASFFALVNIPSQNTLDILIRGLAIQDSWLKQKIRETLIQDYGREALGGLLRGIPENKEEPIYLEIVSLMEDLDLFTLIAANFKKPDDQVKDFYFNTLVQFNRPEFLELYLEYYPQAERERRLKIEEIFLEYSVKDILAAFKGLVFTNFDEYYQLFDRAVVERLGSDKSVILEFLYQVPDSSYKRKVIAFLFENIDVLCYDAAFLLLKDHSSDVKSMALRALTGLIDETNHRLASDNEPNKDFLKQHYQSWEKSIVNLMRDLTKLVEEHRRYIKKLFFVFVKHNRPILNNFVKSLFLSSFSDTYKLIREWSFEEQVEVYDWVLKSDPSFGGIVLSGLSVSSEDNMWRLVLKLAQRFTEKEDSDVYYRNLVLRYRTAAIDKYTQDKDPEIRVAAMEVMKLQGAANVLSIAKGAVKDYSAPVRLQALKVLHSLNSDGLVEILTDAADDPDKEVVQFAMSTLAEELSSEELLPIMMRFINSPVEELRNIAMEHVANVTKKRYRANFNSMPVEVRKLTGRAIQKLDNSFADQLVGELSSFDPQARLQAVLLLENLEVGDQGKMALVAAMKDPSRQVRAAVVKALGLMNDPELIKYLIEFFNDPDMRVRANTIEAVASMGDRQVVKFLLPFVEDGNNRIRGNAIVGIRKLGNYNVVPMLQKMLMQSDEGMRATGLWAIGEIGDVNLLPFVYPLMGDTNEMIRYNAVRAVFRLSPEILAKYYMDSLRKDPSERIRKLVAKTSYKVI